MQKNFARTLKLVLLSAALPSYLFAGSGDQGQAQMGQAIGQTLSMVGAVTLAQGMATCSTPAGCNAAMIAGGIAELAGGMLASMQNGQAASELASHDPGYTSSPGSIPTAGSFPGAPNPADQCLQAPGVCNCINTDCSVQQLNLPELPEIRRLTLANPDGRTSTTPDGANLSDALNNLDANYAKAAEAVAQFNANSAAGNSGAGSDPSFANLSGQESGPGLNTDHGLASIDGTGSTNILANRNGLDPLEARKREREPVSAAKINGLNMEDSKTGKLLTLFERVTRAIRGDRDRDLLLAKIEWSRKAALKKLASTKEPLPPKKISNSVIKP